MNIKIFNKREEAQLNMIDVVIAYFDANPTIVALNLGFKEAVDEIIPLVAAIKAAAPLSAAPTAGITETKNISKADLSIMAARIAGQIYAYAEKHGDMEMRAAVDVAESELKRMKDGELALRCQAVHDFAVNNLDAVKDYGINTTKLAALQTAITSYAQKVPKPRAAITDRAVVKADVKAKLAQVMKIFRKRLDRLIKDYTETHADFVAAYTEKRKIVDPKSPAKPNGNTTNGGDGTHA